MQPLLEMRAITKSFPGVKALDTVNLTVMPGECISMRRKVIPVCGLPSFEVRTRQNIMSAYCASVVQVLAPLMT